MFGFLHENTIVSAADELRWEALGVRATVLPVDIDTIIYDHLCQNQGLSFNDEADLGTASGEAVLGKMTVQPGRIEISRQLKIEGNEGRLRFTIAHEIGHWVLHRPLILADERQYSLLGSEKHQLVTLNRAINGLTSAPEEIQANMFASELLIPRKQLGEEWGRRNSLRPVATKSGSDLKLIAREAAIARMPGLPALTDVFAVSAEAMAIALLRRKLVAPPASLLEGF